MTILKNILKWLSSISINNKGSYHYWGIGIMAYIHMDVDACIHTCMHTDTYAHTHTQSKACHCCWTVYPDKLGMPVHQAGTGESASMLHTHACMRAHTHTHTHTQRKACCCHGHA